jgi:hypothetical protein
LDVNFESLDDMPLVLEEPASTPHVVPPVRSTDDRIDTLIGVVSDLVSRVDSTQRQLDSLHLTLSTPLPADDVARFRARFRARLPMTWVSTLNSAPSRALFSAICPPCRNSVPTRVLFSRRLGLLTLWTWEPQVIPMLYLLPRL